MIIVNRMLVKIIAVNTGYFPFLLEHSLELRIVTIIRSGIARVYIYKLRSVGYAKSNILNWDRVRVMTCPLHTPTRNTPYAPFVGLSSKPHRESASLSGRKCSFKKR